MFGRTIASTAFILATTASIGMAATLGSHTVSNAFAQAGGNIDGGCGDMATSKSTGVGAVATSNGAFAGCTGEALAFAEDGFIGVSSNHELSSVGVLGSARKHGSTAGAGISFQMQFGIADSYVYQGPVLLGVNFTFDAQLASIIDMQSETSSFSTGTSALVSGSVTLTGSTNNINVTSDRATFSAETSASANPSEPSDSSSASPTQNIYLEVLADPRRALSVTLNLGANSFVQGRGDSSVKSSANATQTLSFAKDRDVFVLPEGVSASIPSLYIFDNRWVDPRIPVDPDPSAVPLPAGMPLLLISLGAFAAMRAKKSI